MTLEDIDAETDADLEARHRLMVQRIELDQAARHAAANSRPQPRGNLMIYVPPSMGSTTYYGPTGRSAQARVADNGRLVIDLFVGEFKSLLMGRDGLHWHNSNPEAVRALGQT
jgi:hypothetical protein